ncbi:MAG: alpha/beta hydrolase, partial [Pseudomonadota bacterium]
REAVPVIGHSFGAVVALRAAVERPGRVSSLVVIEPPFYAALEGNYMQQTVFSEMAAVKRNVESGNFVMAAKEFVKSWGTGQPWDEIEPAQRNYMMPRMDLVIAGEGLLWKDKANLLGEGRLEQIDIPVTLVEGDASHPAMTPIIDAIGRRIPEAEGIIVPGAGHMVPMTHPVAVAEAVRPRLVWGFPEDD